MTRPPVPPFTEETARQKIRAAEDARNSRDPEKVSRVYTHLPTLTLNGDMISDTRTQGGLPL